MTRCRRCGPWWRRRCRRNRCARSRGWTISLRRRPRKISASSRAERPKRLEDGKMYGTSAVIADGDSKSYSLEAGSYFGRLTFHKPGRGVYTMTDPPIVITAGQTRTLTITADGKLNY